MYPEYFPVDYKGWPRRINNHQIFVRIGDSLGINQIDFNTWFCTLKKNRGEVLYPKQGNHWSVFGSYLAGDSLIRYIEKLRKIRMPHPVSTKTEFSGKPRETDDDIAETLNLIFPITSETFCYPIVSYPEQKGMVKPKVIYIGDSFVINWVKDGIMDHTNTDWQYWQWFSLIWDKSNEDGASGKRIPDTDWVASINNSDCIVIMYTSFNLPNIGNGFIEAAFDHYFPKKR